MTSGELFQAIQDKWGGKVFFRLVAGEGIDPSKEVVECGVEISATARTRMQPKTITFDTSCIPDDALDKIASVIA